MDVPPGLAVPVLWPVELADAGLIAIPGWGGGKLMAGTNQKAVADHPPTRQQMLETDYSEGLVLVTGTAHPAGGFVHGIDVDEGPSEFPTSTRGFLYLEKGTGVGKWHLFIRTADRLDGQSDLVDHNGQAVAEIKGYGRSLRSYPTLPADKPRGYEPIALNKQVRSGDALMTVDEVASGLAQFLQHAIGRPVSSKCRQPRPWPNQRRSVQVLGGRIGRIKSAVSVVQAADRHTTLAPAGPSRLKGLCPIHDERTPSFVVYVDEGRWHCYGACGVGGDVIDLAQKLMEAGKW